MFLSESQSAMLLRFASGENYVFHKNDAEDEIVRFLIGAGLVAARVDKGADWFELTQKGCATLSEVKEKATDKAEQKAHNRTQTQLAIANVLVSFVSFALGLVVEHYAGLVAFLSQLFGRGIN